MHARRSPVRIRFGGETQNSSASISSSELSSHQMSVGATCGLFLQSGRSSAIGGSPVSTTAKGLFLRLRHQVLSLRHRRRRGTCLPPQMCPPLQQLAVRSCGYRRVLFRTAPARFTSPTLPYTLTRAMVHVRRARRCPSSDTTPYVVDKLGYASSFSPRVMPCW